MSDLFSFKLLYGGSDLESGDFRVDLEANVDSRSMAALGRVNNIFLARIRDKLYQAGSGIIYRSRWGGGARHQASAPGEPPAPDLELYRDSWEAEVESTTEGVVARITSSLWSVLGRRMELGGHGGGVYIAPRPHVTPVLDALEPYLEDEFTS